MRQRLFGSGMAAATAIVLALPQGSHMVASQVMYWAFRNWLANDATRFGYRVTFADTTDLAAIRDAVTAKIPRSSISKRPATRCGRSATLQPSRKLPHGAGAMLAVDSTVATPIFTQPLSLGADLVMHSATKYLNGHSDVIAGALATAHASSSWEQIKSVRARHGAILGPFEAWLLQRGLRTLRNPRAIAGQRAQCGLPDA